MVYVYKKNNTMEHEIISWKNGQRRGKIASGILIILFGTLLLLNSVGIDIPHWIFKWESIVIGIGIVVLIRHKFRKSVGYFLIVLGTLFLFKEWYPDFVDSRVIIAVLLIGFGLTMIFKPTRNQDKFNKKWLKKEEFKHIRENWTDYNQDDFLDVLTIFGGVEKNITSKNFKGADVVTIFGGNEIDLTQADFEQRIVIDITTLFGGTTLLIPSHWEIKSDVVTIFGGLEDKRIKSMELTADTKTIVLRGVTLFGGIEISSFAK